MKAIVSILITFIIFYIFNNYNKIIGLKCKLIDKQKKIPLLGGIFLIIGLILNYFFIYDYFEIAKIDFIVLFFLISLFFIALIDDIFNLNPLLRLVLCSIIITVFFVESGFLVKTLNFKYFGVLLFQENIILIYFFSIFCMIVLIHAFNFIDGMNGLASLIGLAWLTYIIFKLPEVLPYIFLFLIYLLFFIYLNLKNKIFLGDSGNYIISSLIGILIIRENLINPYTFYVEEIFLLFLIPGLDLIRLFFLRIKNKKNPFYGDANHFHHLLLNKYKAKKALAIYLSLVTLPMLVFILNESLLLLLIVLSIISYTIILKKFLQ